MRDFDLRSLMKGLYQNLEYFAKIPTDGEVNYEEDYHAITIDPDGNQRELLNERSHYLAGVKEITDFIDTLLPGKILDIGCGPGWILSSLDAAWDKHGIEISKFASTHASQFGNIHNGTLEDYDGIDFDVIIMNHVIEHLTDPVDSIKRIRGLLKSNGYFLIGTPDFDCAAARRYGSKFRLLHDPTHISLFSADSMHRLLRDSGFKILDVEYPFFDTQWFTKDNLMRLLSDDGISPPFYGSNMTFFCKLEKD